MPVKILLDHNIDWRLKRLLPDHEVHSTKEIGWERLTNGQLLTQAQAQFDVLLTVDRNIKSQQNLTGRQIASVVLMATTNTRAALSPLIPQLEVLLPSVEAGQLYEVASPCPHSFPRMLRRRLLNRDKMRIRRLKDLPYAIGRNECIQSLPCLRVIGSLSEVYRKLVGSLSEPDMG